MARADPTALRSRDPSKRTLALAEGSEAERAADYAKRPSWQGNAGMGRCMTYRTRYIVDAVRQSMLVSPRRYQC
jgi:hypothetical protein